MAEIQVPIAGRAQVDGGSDNLVGVDGNAFAVMGHTKQLLKAGGASKDFVAAYLAEAMSSDYDHLLATSVAYLEAE